VFVVFPAHAAPQLENCQPVAGVAVRVTVAPGVKPTSHDPAATLSVRLQSIPVGEDLMLPEPVPLTTIPFCGIVNLALTTVPG
jgi:hypothetical protein